MIEIQAATVLVILWSLFSLLYHDFLHHLAFRIGQLYLKRYTRKTTTKNITTTPNANIGNFQLADTNTTNRVAIKNKAKRQPKYISTDNDPLYHGQWIRNLSILEITELKSIPGEPTSHTFV